MSPQRALYYITTVVSLQRSMVFIPLRLRYVLLRPAQEFYAPKFVFAGFSFPFVAKILKIRLRSRPPFGHCLDTLVSFRLRNSFGLLWLSWKWLPSCLLHGFLAFVRYCANIVWLSFTPCLLLVLYTAAFLSLFELVCLHFLRQILADVPLYHLEEEGSSVGRIEYRDFGRIVKSIVAAYFPDLPPRYGSKTLIVYGVSVPY